MPVTALNIKITYRYTYLGQQCQNTQYYRTQGAAFLTATMLGVLEALWNDQKTALRAVTPADLTVASWDSLLGEEVGGSLGFAEYSIPTGEKIGTRASSGVAEWQPSFVAMGFRQSVATRATRPGQKRFPFVADTDVSNNMLAAGVTTLLNAVASKFSSVLALGAPVATGSLVPVVRAENPVPGLDPVYQDVTGYVTNPYVTSQVSRKRGRGV